MPGKKTKRQARKTSIKPQPKAQPVVSTVISGNGARTSDREFGPNYSYVISDLRRIGVLAGSFFLVLIVLAFLIPVILH